MPPMIHKPVEKPPFAECEYQVRIEHNVYQCMTGADYEMYKVENPETEPRDIIIILMAVMILASTILLLAKNKIK